jgi:hypothetical protein
VHPSVQLVQNLCAAAFGFSDQLTQVERAQETSSETVTFSREIEIPAPQDAKVFACPEYDLYERHLYLANIDFLVVTVPAEGRLRAYPSADTPPRSFLKRFAPRRTAIRANSVRVHREVEAIRFYEPTRNVVVLYEDAVQSRDLVDPHETIRRPHASRMPAWESPRFTELHELVRSTAFLRAARKRITDGTPAAVA